MDDMFYGSFHNRLTSFEKWAKNVDVSHEELAKKGFYFTGNADVIKCYKCGRAVGSGKNSWPQHECSGRAGGRARNDVEERDHALGASGSSDAQGAGNVDSDECVKVKTTSDALRLLQDDKHTQNFHVERKQELSESVFGTFGDFERYKDIDARRLSFDDRWPRAVPVDVQELARAGWFYTGRADRVRCPWCKGSVYNWVLGDTALGEHKRHYPNCAFVENLLAAAFTKIKPVETVVDGKKSNESKHWKKWPSVRAVLELGYTENQIKNALGKLDHQGIPG